MNEKNTETTIRRVGGYLLLESLLALAVFVLAAGAMVGAVNDMARSFKTGSEEVAVARLVESCLAEAMSVPTEWMTQDGWEAQREFDGRYTVMTRIFPTELVNQDDIVLSGFFKVVVSVSSKESGSQWVVESLRYLPELASTQGNSSGRGGGQ